MTKEGQSAREMLKAIWRKKGVLVREVGEVEVLFSSTPGKLGLFSEGENLIILSPSLIGTNDLIDVFLHEASHALDYHRRGYSEHDEVFRKICRDLGVKEGFEKAKIKRKEEDREKMMRKAEKLMALSASPFENESAEALKKAQSIIAEHSLGTENDNNEETLYYVIFSDKKRYEAWEKTLHAVIKRLSGAFILRDSRNNKTEIRAYGDEETAETAGFFYEYFMTEAMKEKKKAKEKGLETRSYLYGLMYGLFEKLGENESAERALVLSSLRSEKIFRNIENTKVHHRHGRDRLVDRNSFDEGLINGKRMTVPVRRKDGKENTAKYLKDE